MLLRQFVHAYRDAHQNSKPHSCWSSEGLVHVGFVGRLIVRYCAIESSPIAIWGVRVLAQLVLFAQSCNKRHGVGSFLRAGICSLAEIQKMLDPRVNSAIGRGNGSRMVGNRMLKLKLKTRLKRTDTIGHFEGTFKR
jgi:hypothetical protein